MIIYSDESRLENGVWTVTRTHSDGVVSVKRCSANECAETTPEEYLDRLLSQHLSGTGQQRAKKTTSVDE
jgi:hypothetical protein